MQNIQYMDIVQVVHLDHRLGQSVLISRGYTSKHIQFVEMGKVKPNDFIDTLFFVIPVMHQSNLQEIYSAKNPNFTNGF